MLRIINTLLEEHRNMEMLLCILEQELEVFDHRERPDYEILQAIIQYFQGYPENCHHPKEDMVFQKMRMRDSTSAKSIGDIEAEHQVETERLRRFAQAVESILAEQEFPRQTFDNVVHDFIEHQRQHMDKEERLLFPAAAKALRPEDWAEIDARLSDRNDPLFNGVIDEKFHALQQRIVRWERETEENRVKTN